MKVTLGGERNVFLKKPKEHYVVDLPDVELRNIVFGNKYLYF